MLVLRTCCSDYTSYGGFRYPHNGYVEAPDWNTIPECGGGLHGALRGEGDGELFIWDEDALWQIIEVEEWIDLKGKVKFPRGNVVFTGNRVHATNMVKSAYPDAAVIGHICGGQNALAGYKGVAMSGERGNATAGDYGCASACDFGMAKAGNYGKATVGNWGHASVGLSGVARAGDGGRAHAGNHGKAFTGSLGVAYASYWGSASAGEDGRIQIEYVDSVHRRRLLVGYIGEGGLLPNTLYQVQNGSFVRA